jgi:cysteine-rich repeat protein
VLFLAAPAAGQGPLPNVPFDSNGNGTADLVIVDGDYDGDGRAEPEDIQAAVHAVRERLPGEQGVVVVRAGAYREPCRGPGDPAGYCAGDPHIPCDPAITDHCTRAGLSGGDAACVPLSCEGWDTRPYAGTGLPRPNDDGLIALDADDANLILACEPGTLIEGIANKRRFDGSSPPLTAGGLGTKDGTPLTMRGVKDVRVIGCAFEAGMPRGIGAYDPVARDWPLVADGGSATTLVDAEAGWLDDEWNGWWLLLRPGCDGPQSPYAWCSAAEEIAWILRSEDATDTLELPGVASAPLVGDRYVILYHSGGVCSGDWQSTCETNEQCGGGICWRIFQDDPNFSHRKAALLARVEDVRLESVRLSGSAHAGLYIRNSRRVDVIGSELFENGGYYGRGFHPHFPSIYLFSGTGCLDDGTDCRVQDVHIEDTEIHHGGTGVNPRWDAKPGQLMYVEGLEVRNGHFHDLFAADGTGFPAILCTGRDATCEGNLIERAGGGVSIDGNLANGWPSESPLPGNHLNSWNVVVRDNVIRDLWSARGAAPVAVSGIYTLAGIEDLLLEENTIEGVGTGSGAQVWANGLLLNGPLRNAVVRDPLVHDVLDASVYVGGDAAAAPPVGDWTAWISLEANSEDRGIDPASHQGDPAGFADALAIERVEINGGRVVLRDDVDAGRRGGAGGVNEALYVSTLVMAGSNTRLDLNGIHLYYETLIGDASRIIDVSAECPDGAPDPGEACDDGNLEPGDGCSADCRLESEAALWGLAEGGGTVTLWVEGIPVAVPTLPGENSRDVLAALAGAILAEPALAGVSAVALGNRLVVNTALGGLIIDDPGLADSLPRVPVLGAATRLLLALAVVAAAVPLLAFRSSTMRWIS